MKELILFAGTVFMGMFAIMNPIANTPIFIGLTQSNTPAQKRKIAIQSVLYAFIIVSVFCVSGHFIFKLFGITLPAFQITGGILLFLVGYSMIQGKKSAVHHFPDSADAVIKKMHEEDEMNIAVSPLAIPILAGPGTIATAMNFVGASSGVFHLMTVVISFAALCLLTLIMFVYGEKFINYLGRAVVGVITRIMGLILSVIATQMVIVGINGAIELYKTSGAG